MKFGEAFRQFSVPEWAAHNIDYDEIKMAIRRETSEGKQQSITIPGQSQYELLSEGFEHELYDQLYEEHDRIELFCKSKTGEISRRLEHLGNRIQKLQRFLPQSPSAVRVRKLSKLEEGLLKVGHDIQNLSRFIAAQKLAFQKLMKKYEKYSGSSALAYHFRKSVLQQSSHLGPQKDPVPQLLSRYTSLLETVRAPFDTVSARCLAPSDAPQLSVEECHGNCEASDLHDTYETASDMDADAAFFAVPQGRDGGRSTYWVHNDNLIQANVLLQTFTRVRGASRKSSASSVSSRSPKSFAAVDRLEGTTNGSSDDKKAGFAIFDNSNNFAKRRIRPSNNEHGPRAALSFHYCGAEKTLIAAFTPPLRRVRLKRKDLPYFTARTSLSNTNANGDVFGRLSPGREEDIQALQKWANERPNIQPLVKVDYRRTRFVGLSNSRSKGLWANLDTDVRYEDLGTDQIPELGITDEAVKRSFPYAILEVRWEGQVTPQLIQVLDKGYIAEKVPGFSIEAHAVADTATLSELPAPPWLSKLNEDIRKAPQAPAARARLSRHSSYREPRYSTGDSTASTTDGQSSSGLTAQGQTSLTSDTDVPQDWPHKLTNSKLRQDLSLEHTTDYFQSRTEAQRSLRYWNEFEDSSERAANDEPYTILVSPDPWISDSVLSFLSLGFWKPKPKEPKSADAKTAEQRPLLSPNLEAGLEGLPSDPDSGTPTTPAPRKLSQRTSPNDRRSYFTFPKHHSSKALRGSHSRPRTYPNYHNRRDNSLFHFSWSSFLLSTLFLIMSCTLEFTGRRRYTTATNAMSIVGIAAGVFLAGLGVVFTFERKDRAGRVDRAAALLGAVVLWVVGGVLGVAIVDGGGR